MEFIIPVVGGIVFVYLMIRKIHREQRKIELVPLDPMEIIHDDPKKDLKLCGGTYYNIHKCE